MSFFTRTPIAPLFPYVEMLWYAEGLFDGLRGAGLPQSRMGLVINLGAGYGWEQDDGSSTLYDKYWIQGMMERPMIVASSGRTRMLGVKFRPGGASVLLGGPLHSFSGLQIGADELWGGAVNSLREQMLDLQNDTTAIFSLMESFLLQQQRSSHFKMPPAAFLYALNMMHSPYKAPRVQEICREAGVSRKHLAALFKDYIGISPKQYQRLNRFGAAVQAIASQRYGSLTSTGYAVDYYDQAHFINEFQSFSGCSPGTYLQAERVNPFFVVVPAGSSW